MSAYYNENDPRMVEWLRILIKAQVIADGEVDSRSVVAVRPDELRGFTQCHFFAGLGGWSYALRLAGWPDDEPVWTGSCPCQPFSVAGRQRGDADIRHLWPTWFALIRECRPVTLFGEQVASPLGVEWLDAVHADLEAEGYAVGAIDLCAAGIGAPHRRQRLWWLGIARSPGLEGHAGDVDNGHEPRRLDALASRPAPASGAADQLADDDGEGRPVECASRLHADGASGDDVARCGQDDSVAHAAGDGRSTRRDGAPLEESGAALADDGSAARELALAGRQSSRRRDSRPGESAAPPDERAPDQLGGSGAACDVWRDADWLYCRDGKWRPVEPGTFPLADGVPSRVGRLRGYGNAIVPQLAAEVIKAYLELKEHP